MNEPNQLKVDLRALPAGIRAFVDVLGVEKAIGVLTEQGGQVFYIPKHPTPNCEFVKVFGMDMCMALSRYAEQQYQVPMLNKVLAQVRNQTIVDEVAKGTTIQELVKRFKITRQWINKILHEYKAYEVSEVYREQQMEFKL